MCKFRATKKRKEVRAVKSEPNAVRHFKVGPVLKIDATFHSRLNLCDYQTQTDLEMNCFLC